MNVTGYWTNYVEQSVTGGLCSSEKSSSFIHLSLSGSPWLFCRCECVARVTVNVDFCVHECDFFLIIIIIIVFLTVLWNYLVFSISVSIATACVQIPSLLLYFLCIQNTDFTLCRKTICFFQRMAILSCNFLFFIIICYQYYYCKVDKNLYVKYNNYSIISLLQPIIRNCGEPAVELTLISDTSLLFGPSLSLSLPRTHALAEKDCWAVIWRRTGSCLCSWVGV